MTQPSSLINRIKMASASQRLIQVYDEEPTELIETLSDDEEEKVAQVDTTPVSINLFQHPDAHPLVLDLALLRKYQLDWIEWEPDTLRVRIPQDFRTTEISDLNMSKVQAMKSLHLVDSFWKRWEVFVWCCMPLNGIYPNFRLMQVPTVAQSVVAVDIANKVRSDIKWSTEVKAYLEVVYRHDEVFCPVAPLDFVDIEIPELVDCKAVSKRWDEIRMSGKEPTAETIVDEQLRRMLVIHQYLLEDRNRFRSQVGKLKNV